MITQPPQDRKIFFLFPLALISLFLLGTVRFLLDNLKNNQFQYLWQNKFLRVPINVSENEIIEESCNVFEGKWVWDNVTYPLYKEETCPYLVKQVTCQRNGRRDSFYQNWRWQPHGCNLPRFNALKMLEMLRDKRLMFIGDSIQRGMFESMVCLVQSVIADVDHSIERVPPRKSGHEFNFLSDKNFGAYTSLAEDEPLTGGNECPNWRNLDVLKQLHIIENKQLLLTYS